ncbi:MAG: RagB/SusD family nutrient uptake outer membrane protein [Bacteroidia bacterium]|nr:RagB/SusD family nutrient uptake outer membrane protein [Bacteroidia bacterium]
MNKITYILSIMVLAGILFQCKDALVEEPLTQYSVSNLTPASAVAAVNGIYEPMQRSRGRYYESWFMSVIESKGDYVIGRDAVYRDFARFIHTTSNYQSRITAFWNIMYEAIGRANNLINALQTSNLEASLRNELEAEARTVRAFNYYNLVRLWGEVPLRLQSVQGVNDLAKGLSSREDIYDAIIADLEFAEDNLPSNRPENELGRVTEGAAKLFLADVYLTMGTESNDNTLLALARDKAKEVIDNKAIYGYELVPSYPDIFSESANTTSEEVWAIKFIEQIGFGSFIPVYLNDPANRNNGPRGLRTIYGNDQSPLLNNWDDNDLRKNWNIYTEFVNVNGVTQPITSVPSGILFSKFRASSAPEETAAGNDFHLFRFADALLIFAEAENLTNGPTTTAYDAVNQIRRRSYGFDVNTPNAMSDFPAGLTPDQFDDLIIQERAYEFMTELKRWFDLKRKGIIAETLNNSGPERAGFYTTELEYWTIPQVEIDNNPALQ